MFKFITRRVIQLIPILFGVITVTFLIMYIIPGDPVLSLVGERYDEATIEKMREEFGLDKPLPLQYADYIGRVARLDFGRSFMTGRPVIESIKEYFPRTLVLAFTSMLIAVAAGVVIGAVSSLKRFRWLGRGLMTFSLVGVSIPVFWLGLLLIYLFAIKLSLLPPSGYGNGSLRYLILPAVTLSFASMATVARVSRSSFLDISSEEFIKTARAKGLNEFVVFAKHLVRNALIPVITIVGTDFGSYLGGSVLTESIFGWPGLGRHIVQAILKRDFPVIQGAVLFMALLFVLVNLLVDLSYGFIDPRVRVEGKRG
ncbi:MAG: ABC transporter permease [Candidatus Krumholzibacteriota bacterium]|nr:ABC transporter permease [Candidatus Krumholzibacteriota bacterium]